MIRKKNSQINDFTKKFLLYQLFSLLQFAVFALGIIYYWSFYHYNHIFEDRVIDEQNLKYDEELGIKNEWLLGVTTDSIVTFGGHI